MRDTIIRIRSNNLGGNTPVQVNGHTLITVPHNEDVKVTEAELEALTNSNVSFEIVDGAAPAAPEVAAAPVGGSSGAAEPADGKTAGEAAHDLADEQTGDGPQDEQPPVEIDLGTLDGETFVVGDVLAGTIPMISEKMDRLTAAQVAALIEAEKGGQNRSTLITAFEARATTLAA